MISIETIILGFHIFLYLCEDVVAKVHAASALTLAFTVRSL